MTVESDQEKTAAPHPPSRARVGESSSACRPTFCCSSDSVPTSPGSFDSVEPRCTSQTVTRIMRKNCRYSDCQFSATSTAKLEDVTYAQNETRSAPELSWSWL